MVEECVVPKTLFETLLIKYVLKRAENLKNLNLHIFGHSHIYNPKRKNPNFSPIQ